jgi:hypothetical protein
VAPLVPRARIPGAVGRLTPIVKVKGVDYALMVPRLTTVPAAELRAVKGNLLGYRSDIVAALEVLYLGV